MSNIETSLPFPLDDDGFFRRECPFCRKEFKVWLKQEELTTLAQAGIDSFMIQQDEETSDTDETSEAEIEFFCPYCGERASRDSWWTQEQLAYIGVVGRNIAVRLINENLIRPQKREFGRSRSSGLVSIRFEAKEMEQEEPWISPEANDMQAVDLPCCERKLKVQEGWAGTVHCFFCGFPRSRAEGETRS